MKKLLLMAVQESTLTAEKLIKAVDVLLKNKIDIKTSKYIEEDMFYIIDHEKLRESIPFHEERGKTIVCHPKNEAKIRAFMNPRGGILCADKNAEDKRES